MADEPKPESQTEDSQSPVKAASTDGKEKGFWLAVSLIFVVGAVAGIFSYALDRPLPWLLGGGLLGWGLLDFFGQRAALRQWSGKDVVARNLVNIGRALFFSLLGGALIAQGLHYLPASGANSLLMAGIAFSVLYFVVAYVLELTTRSKEIFPHALLLAALALQFASFFCFAVLFSLNWAGVLCATAFLFAGWAVFRGVVKIAGSLASSVALVVLLLGLPFSTFFIKQVFFVDVQPVFQASLFLPRYYEMQKELDRQVGNLAWAPGNNQAGAIGDIPYSDKIAFTDEKDGEKTLGIHIHLEDASFTLNSPMDPGPGPARWSPDSKRLAAVGTDPQTHKNRLSLYRWTEGGAMAPQALRSIVKGQDAMPIEDHGQLWSPDSRHLYFAAPASLRKLGGVAIWKATFGSDKDKVRLSKITSGGSKISPAISPNGKKLLYVLEKENDKYFDLGDTKEGLNSRRFILKNEMARFPAWNAEQTQVLFVDKAGSMKVMSANNKSDARDITPKKKIPWTIWKSDDGKVFTLHNREYQYPRELWVSDSEGRRPRMLYISPCDEILSPVWAPDSGRLAFIERTGKKYAVWSMMADGAWRRRFFASDEKVRSLSWSPDGARLSWFADRNGGEESGQELWVADKDGSNPEMGYRGSGELSGISWSPTGQHIAFEERWSYNAMGLRVVRPDLYSGLVLDLKSKAVRSLTPAGLFARQPVFSPQGVMIAFSTEQNRWSLLPSAQRPVLLAGVKLF